MQADRAFELINPLICFVVAGMFLFLYSERKQHKHILLMGLAYALTGTGFLISGLFTGWQPAAHLLVTQTLYLSGLTTVVWATCHLTKKAPPAVALIATGPLALIGMLWAQGAFQSADPRIMVTNVGQGLIFAYGAWAIRPVGSPSRTQRYLFWIMTAITAQHFLRPAIVFQFENGIEISQFRNSLYWATLNSTVAAMSIILALALLYACWRESDKEREGLRQEDLKQLSGGIAHNFNNLLMVISGHADIAKEKHSGDNYEEIMRSVSQGAQISRQMLRYAGSSGRTVTAVDLNSVVTDVAQEFERSLSDNSTIQLHLQQTLPQISADETELKDLLTELIKNAREASEAESSGIIEIRTKLSPTALDTRYGTKIRSCPSVRELVILEVIDQGTGIPREDVERVFEPFFSTSHTSPGLGLSVVKGIADRNDWGLWVRSSGHGTTVTIGIGCA